MDNLRRLLPIFRMRWMLKREAPTNFTHVCVTTGNLLAGITFVWGAFKYFEQKENEREAASSASCAGARTEQANTATRRRTLAGAASGCGRAAYLL